MAGRCQTWPAQQRNNRLRQRAQDLIVGDNDWWDRPRMVGFLEDATAC